MIQLSKQFLSQTIATANEKLRKDLKEELVDELTRKLEETIENKLSEIQTALVPLKEDIENLKKTANDAYETSSTNTDNISKIEVRLQKLEDSFTVQSRITDDLQHKEVNYKKDIDILKKTIDDQINRSMRGNLVFFGLEENENDDYNSKNIVANFIFENLYDETDNITLAHILGSIVRAHRSKFRPERDPKKGPRPVYVKFSRDDIAATYLKKCIVRKVTHVRVKQQYTPELQARIDSALKLRRELFDTKKITKGYVEYPATLKGVLVSSPTKGYTTIQSF